MRSWLIRLLAYGAWLSLWIPKLFLIAVIKLAESGCAQQQGSYQNTQGDTTWTSWDP